MKVPFDDTELLFIWHYALHAEADLQRLQTTLGIAGKAKKYHEQIEWSNQAEVALRRLCQWARQEIESTRRSELQAEQERED